jgi:hypothetical protein
MGLAASASCTGASARSRKGVALAQREEPGHPVDFGARQRHRGDRRMSRFRGRPEGPGSRGSAGRGPATPREGPGLPVRSDGEAPPACEGDTRGSCCPGERTDGATAIHCGTPPPAAAPSTMALAEPAADSTQPALRVIPKSKPPASSVGRELPATSDWPATPLEPRRDGPNASSCPARRILAALCAPGRRVSASERPIVPNSQHQIESTGQPSRRHCTCAAGLRKMKSTRSWQRGSRLIGAVVMSTQEFVQLGPQPLGGAPRLACRALHARVASPIRGRIRARS